MPDTSNGGARHGFRPSTKYQVPGTSERKTSQASTDRGRPLRFALFTAVLGLVLASCGAGGVVATVNSVNVLDDQVLSLSTEYEGESTVSAEMYRNDLTNVIVTVAAVTAAEDELGLGDLSSTESTDAYLASATLAEIELLGRVATQEGRTEAAVDLATVQLNVRSSVKESIVSETEYLQGIWQNDQNLLIQACARHVLVATEEEAIQAKERFDAGEDLSSIATEISLDTQSPGGALPCPSSPADYVQPFSSVVATAPVGELAGPVETQFGWHIILVDSRESPQTLDELALDPLKWIPSALLDAAWTGWLNRALEDADIEVTSQVGTWYSAVDGILPPPPSP